MMPRSIKQSFSRHEISVHVTHFALSECPASNSALFQEAARIILDGRTLSNSWMQRTEARNAAAHKAASTERSNFLRNDNMRVAFQGEAGAFSEAAAVQLCGDTIITVPRPTFDATFRAIPEGHADALLVPVENSLAGSVVRVYDLLLESQLTITAETILPIEMNLIGCPGAVLSEIRSVSSHPMALAQCERFFGQHPSIRR